MIKKHYLAFLLAIVVGLITLVPQLLAIKDTPQFAGIYKMINNDESYYFARGKDVIDGHSFLSNPYIYEYKEGLPVQVWLPDYLLAKPLGVLGIEIHKGYIAYDFILPFILTLLTYAIIFTLTKNIGVSLLGATLLHLNFFLDHFNRAPSPQFNFIFWLLMFLSWIWFMKKPTWSNAIVMGIALGILFHIYPYYWTFYVVFFVIFLVGSFILKQPVPYRKYALAFLVAFLIAIPYFIILYKSALLPYYNETLARVGMISTHFPSGKKMVVWGSIAFMFFVLSYRYLRLQRDSYSTFFISGILSTIVVVNQHIITGKNLQFSSHYWQLSVFIYVFALLYLTPYWWPRLKPGISRTALITIVIGYIFLRPVNYLAYLIDNKGIHYTPLEISYQSYAPVFKWLRENTKKEDVVFANNELSTFIPIYTENNIFFHGLAGLHFMPNAETQERFVLNNYWNIFDETFITNNSFNIWGAYYPTRYDHNQSKNKLRKVLGLETIQYVKFPREEIEKIVDLARLIKSKDFHEQLKKYRVDYFVWDRNKDKQWKMDTMLFLERIAQINGIEIYRYRAI